MQDFDSATNSRERQLAEMMGCLLPEDFRLLCGGIAENTEAAWNKRGQGPPSIRVGKQRLYPKQPLQEWLQARMKARTGVAAGSML